VIFFRSDATYIARNGCSPDKMESRQYGEKRRFKFDILGCVVYVWM
jgi:hypothetical protein